MSQDLFAAFGDEDQPESTPQKTFGRPERETTESTSSRPNDDLRQIWRTDDLEPPESARQSTFATPKEQEADVLDDDDDDFGEFEDAPSSSAPVAEPVLATTSGVREAEPATPVTVPSTGRKGTAKPFPPKAPPITAILKSQPSKQEGKKKSVGQHPFAGHMDFLFEAGDDEYDAGADELADLSSNPEAAMAYSKRIIAVQEAAQQAQGRKLEHASSYKPAADIKPIPSVRLAKASKPLPAAKPETKPHSGPNKLRKKSGYVPAKDADVLFDADNVSENDDRLEDFGNFEGGNDTETTNDRSSRLENTQTQAAMRSMDLLGLDDSLGSKSTVNGNESKPSSDESVPGLPDTKATTRKVTIGRQAQPVEQDDDAWDDFEEAAPSSQPSATNLDLGSLGMSQAQPAITSAPSKTESLLPPTNVPPPVVLLSLFPSLFAAADDALFNMMAKLDLKQRQMLLAHPASHQFLKGYLGHCTVLAHIIAGRKSRWKRDQHLSQSMRIGPAAAGGKGGMKLTGVDRSEVAKEDREVLDTLRLWKVQVGKLRSAVTAASTAPGLPKLPAVPEIAEAMPVKVSKPVEGGITASHACALCGLRREERVARVDGEVEDSFGEWWVQGINMHLSCRNFWEEYERKLKSR